MNQQIKKKHIDYGFGFPVVLLNVPVVKLRGVITPNINQKAYREAVLRALAHKPVRLTGNETRFIRHCFEMTTTKFGKRFGGVSHPAVLKWEKSGDTPTDMNWSTEKDIRMGVLKFLDDTPNKLAALYEELEEIVSDSKGASIEIEAGSVAA